MNRLLILTIILLFLSACNDPELAVTSEATSSATATQNAPETTHTPANEVNQATATLAPVNTLAATSTATENDSAQATTVTIEQPKPTSEVVATSYPAPATVVSIDESDESDESDPYPAPDATEGSSSESSDNNLPFACLVPPEARFATLLQSQPELAAKLACPLSEPEQSAAVWQPFERGNQMIWLGTQDAILAMYDGQWHAYEDTFEESDPETPPGGPLPPNEQLIQPERGFGKVWINIHQQMGFGAIKEKPYDTTYQQFQGGWLMTNLTNEVLFLQGLSDFQQGIGDYELWIEHDGQWVDQAPPNGS